MTEIIFVWSRPRKELGRTVDFQNFPPEVLIDLHPNREFARNYVTHDPSETDLQCTPELSEHSTNTERKTLVSRGQFHTEGGWPKDIDIAEQEHKSRYRRKAEKDDVFVEVTRNLSSQAETTIKSNNAVDIYEQYFDGITRGVEEVEEGPHVSSLGSDVVSTVALSPDSASVKATSAFIDPCSDRLRTPVSLSWACDTRRLAVAYNDSSLLTSSDLYVTSEQLRSYVWDVNSPTAPESWLDPPHFLSCLQFSHKDASAIVGGSHTGLLYQFDIRQKGKPTALSTTESSHRRRVTDIQWNYSKPTELMSLSTDGAILVWDTKNLAQPVESIFLRQRGGSADNAISYCGTSFDSNLSTGSSSKIMVGTEEGLGLMCSRRGKSPNDRISLTYTGHLSSIYSIERNPSCPKFFLTVGDWRALLWMEELRSPIISTRFHSTFLTDGRWHPFRPAVFFTTRLDGMLDVWDLLYRQNDPIFSVCVSDAALHSLRVSPSGQQLAVSSALGTTHLLELSSSLHHPVQNEKTRVLSLLDREAVRERRAVQQQKEAQLKHSEDLPFRGISFSTPDSSTFSGITANYISSLREAGLDAAAIEKDRLTMTCGIAMPSSSLPSATSPTGRNVRQTTTSIPLRVNTVLSPSQETGRLLPVSPSVAVLPEDSSRGISAFSSLRDMRRSPDNASPKGHRIMTLDDELTAVNSPDEPTTPITPMQSNFMSFPS